MSYERQPNAPYQAGDEIAAGVIISEEVAQQMNAKIKEWLKTDEAQEWFRNQQIVVVPSSISSIDSAQLAQWRQERG